MGYTHYWNCRGSLNYDEDNSRYRMAMIDVRKIVRQLCKILWVLHTSKLDLTGNSQIGFPGVNSRLRYLVGRSILLRLVSVCNTR